MMPLVGFLPADRPARPGHGRGDRTRPVRERLRPALPHDGLGDVDGLPAGEGAFLACTFWLADNFALQGRLDDGARVVRAAARARATTSGCSSEEYDPVSGRLLGNFPQAFSHVALVNTALNLAPTVGPADARREQG